MTDPYRPRYAVLEIGHGHCIGYEPPEKHTYGTTEATVHIPDSRIGPYLGDLQEAGIVIDHRTIPAAVESRLNLDAPLLRVSLLSREEAPVPSLTMLMGLDGAFAGLAAKKITEPRWSGLDFVPVGDFVLYWRTNGARTGLRVKNEIWWLDGEHQPIPPAESRWKETN